MIISNKSIYKLTIAAGLLFASCSKSDKDVTTAPPANEPVTTVSLTASNTADAGDVRTASWTFNPDDESADTSDYALSLAPNSTYNVSVKLLDKTTNPEEDLTAEIKERSNYHLFFFQPTPMATGYTVGVSSPYIPQEYWDNAYETNTPPYLNLSVARLDKDNNNPALPLGLENSFVTGASSNGYLRLVLRHQPNVKNGTWTGSLSGGGSTDIDAKFKITIN